MVVTALFFAEIPLRIAIWGVVIVVLVEGKTVGEKR